MKSWLKSWKARLLLVIAVVGPGFITANVDNDAGGIFTYSQAGAQFGYTLLWTMIPITIALIVVQEMTARLGAVTGKGLSDLIREELVVPVCAFVVWVMVVRGTYASIEKIFLAASGFYICYIIAGVLAHPDWKAAAFATVTRPEAAGI